jgi:predicted enzyme related to lactoylglutathione lyase
MANPVKWFEIMGEDSAKLQKFYRDTFGWKMTAPVKEMGNYSMLEGHEPGIGGGLGASQPGEGRRVTIYIETADPQRLLDKAIANGATLLMPVTTITPDTTIAMFSDPAGNTTGLMKANPRPAAAASRTARPRAAGRARTSAARTRAKSTTAKRASTAKTKKRASGRTGRTKRR